MKSKTIRSLKTLNLKGKSMDLTLTPKNIIYGGNATGKSSILDGLKLALLGEHDELGKQGKKLMALAKKGYVSESIISFSDESYSSFRLHPKGDTASVDWTGVQADPATRLNLCPEEFWGKGDTAKSQILLQMCGDSSMIERDYIATSIMRVRHKNMILEGDDSDVSDIQELSQLSKEVIVDGYIPSLSSLESALTEIRSERSKKARDLKVVVSEQVEPSGELDSRAFPDLEKNKAEKELNDLTDRKAEIAIGIAKLKAEEELKKQLEEKLKANEQWESNNPKSDRALLVKEIANYEKMLHSLQEKITETEEAIKESEPKLLSEEQPDRDESIYIKGNATQQDGRLVLQEDTIVWEYSSVKETRDKTNKFHKGQLKAEADIVARINSKTKELGRLEEASPKLTADEEQNYKQLKEIDHKDEIDRLMQVASGMDDSIDKLVAKIEEYGKNKSIRETNASQRKELENAERKYENIKAVLKVIRNIQSDIVNSAVRNAKDTINSVLDGILPSPIDWNGKTLGRHTDDGRWIAYDTFSGSEKAVTQMALGIALASRSELKLAVLDEVSRLDSGNKSRLIKNLNTLVDNKVIAQYIILCIERPEDIDDATLIHTEEQCSQPIVQPD